MNPVEYQLFGRDTWRDPFALYQRLRDEDPVHFSEGRDLGPVQVRRRLRRGTRLVSFLVSSRHLASKRTRGAARSCPRW